MAEEKKFRGTKPEDATTEFARRNPLLASFIPDVLEDAVDALLPDSLEAKLERGAHKIADKYCKIQTDFNLGFGEVAATLLRVCKYATSRFGFGDIVFGVYALAKHHAEINAEDAIQGRPVTSPVMLKWLQYATNLAWAAYLPTVEQFAQYMKCRPEDVLELQPKTGSTRPAYAMGVDHKARQVVLAFRGTTDLNDMITDACATCVPYLDGYAHSGMLKAARWFVKNKLPQLRELCDANPGYGLMLVGHSLGAGTACMLAHLIRRGDPEAGKLMEGVKLHAVGIATPAVLSGNLAEGCNQYITSVVLQHDMVPRFSVYNIFVMREEMDATKWSEKLAAKAADWAVPDIIEHSATYQRLAKTSSNAMSVVMRHLSVAWLAVMQFFFNLLTLIGVLRRNRQLAAAEAEAAGGDGGDLAHRHQRIGLREAARATAQAVNLVMHHPGLAKETIQAVERACVEAAQGDVHALYAPGRLFFLKRSDPPKAEQEVLRRAAKERKAAREAARQAELEAAKAAGKEPPALSDSDSEGEEVYPGATFELIRGAKEERFKRIVLQETCLLDHSCYSYVQGVQKLLEMHRAGAGGARQGPLLGE